MAEKFNFNKGLVKLEEIINKMDSGELSLEESLKYFEEGVKIHESSKDFSSLYSSFSVKMLMRCSASLRAEWHCL